MASKSAQHEQEKSEVIEELLDAVDKTLDRVKVLYEQYFLGMQKQPPAHLHTDVERKLRDLQQMQIRNTALRYRFATVQQKFGSYNTYWRRTLRQIENGTYHRNLAKIGRQAALTGEAVPDEILAAMPKRMREQVLRDRENAIARKLRRDQTVEDGDIVEEVDDAGTNPVPVPARTRDGAHILDDDEDFDVDAFFAQVTSDDAPKPVKRAETFDSEVPTEHEAPRPVHASPAVRAAIPTPPAGVPRATRPSQQIPTVPATTQPIPAALRPPAPSQGVRPLPIMPGASTRTQPVPVETMNGPFPRTPTPRTGTPPPPPPPAGVRAQPTKPPPVPTTPIKPVRPATEPGVSPRQPRIGPPPGMTDADVNALYAKYVKAKEAVGEKAGPGAYGKLLQTINAQAPKIMEQYKARGVDFQVVVKDNQVVIRAKPKP